MVIGNDNYDKKRLIENIKARAKNMNIPIGQLEKDVAVSSGYISRQLGNTTDPDVKFVYEVARKLHTTVDDLIRQDFTRGMTATEEKIATFLLHLRDLTRSDKMDWNSVDVDTLQDILKGEARAENLVPVFQFRKISYDGLLEGASINHQAVLGAVHKWGDVQEAHWKVEFGGPVYWANIDNDVDIIIVDLLYEVLYKDGQGTSMTNTGEHDLEIYLCGNNDDSPLITTRRASSELTRIIREFHGEAEESINRIHLSTFANNVIDSVMNPPNTDHFGNFSPSDKGDNIPF